MQSRLTIGEFATITHLSVKMLRRYHENGVLEPAEIDEWTGYRYYSPDQVASAQMIRRLRDLDMPVREIGALLAEDDDTRRHELLTGHLVRLEEQLERTGDSVAALRRLLVREQEFTVEHRFVGERVVTAVSSRLRIDDVLGWYAEAMAELDAALVACGVTPTGPPGALYDNSLFTDDEGTLTVFRPVGEPPSVGRVAPLTIPSVALAVAVHRGSHADIDVTYGLLGRWVVERGLAIGGPVHETYLVGPRDTPDAGEWRTEIGWPVEQPES